MDINKIISKVRDLKEQGMGTGSVSGGITNVTNKASGPVNIAGLPPDSPPVDLRRKKERGWNIFFRDLVKKNRKKKKKRAS